MANYYQKKAEEDSEKLWKLANNGMVHRKTICDSLGIKSNNLTHWLGRFKQYRIEIPKVIPETNKAKSAKSKTIESGTIRDVIKRDPFALEVMDHTIRPHGDGKWIGELK